MSVVFKPLINCGGSLVTQSCPTLCEPVGCSPPGSSVHGILQARILEWVPMPSSKVIFQTQGSNPHLLCLLHWQAGSLPLVPPGPHYMDTSQIGLGSTCMTLFNFNYLFGDTLLRQSLRGLELQHRSWGLELQHRNWGQGLQLNP